MQTDYSNITIPPRSDRKAFAAHQAEVSIAWGEGKALLWRYYGTGRWEPRDSENWLNWVQNDYAIAPEPPKPKIVPWTFETCPVGAVIQMKNTTCGNRCEGMITRKGHTGATVGNMGVPYYELFEQFEQLDGKPCGSEEVGA